MWGLSAPEGVRLSWGARAIHEGIWLDIVPDRQQASDYEDPMWEKFSNWVSKVGIKELNKVLEAGRHPICDKSSREKWAMTETWPDMSCHIEATPNGSYGYLYIGAWLI